MILEEGTGVGIPETVTEQGESLLLSPLLALLLSLPADTRVLLRCSGLALPIYVMSSCYQRHCFLGALCAQIVNAVLGGWWREKRYNSRECFLKPDLLLLRFGSGQAVLPSPHLRLS